MTVGIAKQEIAVLKHSIVLTFVTLAAAGCGGGSSTDLAQAAAPTDTAFESSVSETLQDPLVEKSLPKSNTLPWPIKGASITDSTIFFGHKDSAGVDQNQCPKGVPPIHLGLDIAAAAGTAAISVSDGIVKNTGSYGAGSGGWAVVETLDASHTYLYAHLNEDNTRIAKNSRVAVGTLIGTIYNMSENGDIPHLHFGIRSGKYAAGDSQKGITCSGNYGFLDPLTYLTKQKIYSAADESDWWSTSYKGSWTFNRVNQFFYFKQGFASLTADTAGQMTYTMKPPAYGSYTLYAKFPIDSSNHPAARYRLYLGTALLSTSTSINQSSPANRGRWVPVIQNIVLVSGVDATVVVDTATTAKGKTLVADGLLLVAN
jgi:Peptidase family M23